MGKNDYVGADEKFIPEEENNEGLNEKAKGNKKFAKKLYITIIIVFVLIFLMIFSITVYSLFQGSKIFNTFNDTRDKTTNIFHSTQEQITP